VKADREFESRPHRQEFIQNKMDDLKTSETLTWTAPSHIHHRRSPGWYLIFLLVSIGLIAYAIYTNSIITAITFFLIITVVLILSSERPTVTTYKITKTGISAGKISYPYKIIKKFWIVYNSETKTLNLETTAYLNNKVILQIGKQNPAMLKKILGQYLTEDLNNQESLSEAMARRFKI
jgi:hypothetical protein